MKTLARCKVDAVGALAVAALALLAPPLRAAPAAAPVLLEALTWTEVRDRVAAGSTTALVPIGGTEQNGPHMVLGKHNVRVQALAVRIAAALGNALVAPVLAYVPEGTVQPPSSHMRFAGTLSIPEATFEALLEGTARSLRQHGFRDIVLLGDHGGYQKSLQRVAARLNREWHAQHAEPAGPADPGAARVHALAAYYDVTQGAYARQLEQRGYSATEIGTHAGLADTSLALAIDPALVRADALARPPRAAEGVYGDPRRASAELGQVGVQLIVETTVAAIRAAVRMQH
jgi:creatinine amidohydrolase/Fe(II)-dependent formamide hydrolase-like protein